MEHKPGQIIKGKVSNIKEYGVFINFPSEYTGLIHISEISKGYVRNVNDFLAVGEKIYTKILSIDEKNKRFELSIKEINYLNGDEVKKGIMETKLGFLPLKEKLVAWIKNKKNHSIDKENDKWYIIMVNILKSDFLRYMDD